MTGEELRQARTRLGQLWALGRPAHCAELGRALEYAGEDPGESVRAYEADRQGHIPRAAAAAVKMLLGGMLPPGGLEAVLSPRKKARRARERRRR